MKLSLKVKVVDLLVYFQGFDLLSTKSTMKTSLAVES